MEITNQEQPVGTTKTYFIIMPKTYFIIMPKQDTNLGHHRVPKFSHFWIFVYFMESIIKKYQIVVHNAQLTTHNSQRTWHQLATNTVPL